MIINNYLPWDGSHLGQPVVTIAGEWLSEGVKYTELRFAPNWSSQYPTGTVYCIMKPMKDLFPCIVEEIKELFGLTKRGIHRLTYWRKEYLLYFVPIADDQSIIWETPLARLDNKHALRHDPQFRREVQKIIIVADLLSLTNTTESQIVIRPTKAGTLRPVGVNELNTTLKRPSAYDYSILSKTLWNKWFGEQTRSAEIVLEITECARAKQIPSLKLPLCARNRTKSESVTESDKSLPPIDILYQLTVTTSHLREHIDFIIKKYDKQYVWYTSFILTRISRHLLASDQAIELADSPNGAD